MILFVIFVISMFCIVLLFCKVCGGKSRIEDKISEFNEKNRDFNHYDFF